LVLPIFDGIYLSISRQKKIYLLHPVLSWYTLGLISYFGMIKLLGIKLEVGHYGR
jgi:hypothetical protein